MGKVGLLYIIQQKPEGGYTNGNLVAKLKPALIVNGLERTVNGMDNNQDQSNFKQ
jgi:hypothetical protein